MPELLEILKSVSDETRYNLIKLLLQHDYCVRALANRLNLSESAVSQHLKILRNSGIVKGDKRGYFTHYYVNRELLIKKAQRVVDFLESTNIRTECKKSSSEDCSKCPKKVIQDK